MQPGDRLLHIDGDRLSRHTVGVNLHLVSRIDTHCTRRKSGRVRRRFSSEHGNGPFNYRDNRRSGFTVDVKLGPYSEYLGIARRDPKAPVIVSRNREERLPSRELDHPLAAGVPSRHSRIRVETKLRAVGELYPALAAMRRLV